MHCAMPRRCVHALLRLDACGPLNNWLGAQIGEERAREAADESRSAKEEAAAAKSKAEALSAELEVEQLRRNHLEDLLEKMFMEQEIYGKQRPEGRGGSLSTDSGAQRDKRDSSAGLFLRRHQPPNCHILGFTQKKTCVLLSAAEPRYLTCYSVLLFAAWGRSICVASQVAPCCSG